MRTVKANGLGLYCIRVEMCFCVSAGNFISMERYKFNKADRKKHAISPYLCLLYGV